MRSRRPYSVLATASYNVPAALIAGPSPRRQLLPALRVSLYDAVDEELQFVTVPHSQENLDAGETVRFQATIPSSRAEVRRLRVGFIPP